MNSARRLLLPALASALALTALQLPSADADPAPAPVAASATAAASSDRDSAEAALQAVEEAFAPGADAPTEDVTLILRDLATQRAELSPADRAVADAYLARPTVRRPSHTVGRRVAAAQATRVSYSVAEATPVCTPDLCLHYVTSTADAPPSADTKDATGAAGANGIPDTVDQALRELTHIHDTYIAAGYRSPKPDGTAGGDDRIDVYLANTGADGFYGYCTSDDPGTQFDVWAYCVLDNDFAEFPNTPLESLQVTAAHEYYHATQFAYDAAEDGWYMEASATWVEDEMYPDVNDNLGYLRTSPLTRPRVSLDSFVSNPNSSIDGWQYGDWSFFRFLTEKYPEKQGALPKLLLDIAKRVDSAPGGPDRYSWQAVDLALRLRGTTAAAQFAAYAVANRRPAQTYAEGRALGYPVAPPFKTVHVSSTRSGKVSATLNHLSSTTFRFAVKSLPSATKLRVAVNMAALGRGSRAVVTTYPKTGRPTVATLKLNSAGDLTKNLVFGSVRYVEITLVNASGRFSCWRSASYSCQGTSLDDRLPATITYKAVR